MTRWIALTGLLAVLALPDPAHRLVDQDAAPAYSEPSTEDYFFRYTPQADATRLGDIITAERRTGALVDSLRKQGLPDTHPDIITARRALAYLLGCQYEEEAKVQAENKKRRQAENGLKKRLHHALT